ncbi:energy transducer TonB [Pseudomonas gingeri NCPPB 3146 = LMG 5327]|uniref:Energy transducer TonB n=3 Tax=Pseudomonas gingeri TaxID=117681 RepID=A0A7Y7XW70_9PSED|nr:MULTISPECIES: energy transducer TonB [Pseudomonas]NVZ24492.1 energy transducer TonB [Pseudomonas gingeri]NVZ74706.1 energy transducer TonB [Pseudomonas gingeri]NWC13443.1 energy transducer TonB [Pseudomonas gingeri]NWE49816.1 energy transducer TonB [Pseudomonas gingeri]PNQ93744.1 energy transducer TonB [Pseudomonas gingeri NCPPB 3146 = LMG 5327]
MTAKLPISPDPVKKSPLRLVKWGAGLLLGAAAAWFLWQWAHDMSGVRREAPKVPMIIPLPPPPPPPPPEPEKPKEPETPVEEKVPEPTPEPEEVKPQEEAPPSPADDLANPMQIDGDAQAGGDAFNIGAGKGGGMAGAGGGRLGNGTYSQFLAYTFQRVLKENPELRNLAFSLQTDVWLSAAGDITRVELVKSSGDPRLDTQVLAALRAAPRLNERPPASMTLPVRISLQGRRPG